MLKVNYRFTSSQLFSNNNNQKIWMAERVEARQDYVNCMQNGELLIHLDYACDFQTNLSNFTILQLFV